MNAKVRPPPRSGSGRRSRLDPVRILIAIAAVAGAVCASGGSADAAEAAAAARPAEAAAAARPAEAAAAAGPVLPLSAYLEEVSVQHGGVRAAETSSEAARLTAREGMLITSPQLFGDAFILHDERQDPRLLALGSYSHLENESLKIGLQKQFLSGPNAKLSYNWSRTEYAGAFPGFYEGRPLFEFSVPLWRNWRGRETKAMVEAAEAGAKARAHTADYQKRALLAAAETAYWRLQLTREVVTIQQEALARAEKIYDWNVRQQRLQLSDKAGALQASAALQARRLELKAAEDEVREAAQEFNSARGVASDKVENALERLTPARLADIKIPDRPGISDDIKAAAERARATAASAEVSRQKTLPVVDVYGQLASNALRGNGPDAFVHSYSGDRTTQSIGIRLTAPLDFGTVKAVRQGWQAEKLAAEQLLQRQTFEKETEWVELTRKFEEAKSRLEMVTALEKLQKSKLDFERDRQRRGRSTTYQVLLFEIDFQQAAIGRVRTLGEILSLSARLKLFEETPAPAAAGGAI